ncbi:transglycosylase SLT domain-containing protein, partial [Streptomyces brasiliscabiei]|uniref:transglycosylase SLT domain-containing protein n=1 Tax=Streptomyces brasiliscabiei TaxID=2736302 RepID=UPI003015098B
ALIMCRAAKKFGVSPYLVAATAKVESCYSMHSTPCIGIMQISKGEAREAKKTLGYDVYKADDNIYIGAWCLSKYGKEMNRGRDGRLR